VKGKTDKKNQTEKNMKTTSKLIYSALAVLSLGIAAVTANGALNDLFASVNGQGNGGGFIYEYTPAGVQSTFASGLSRPRGVAFDSSGNLFVATSPFDDVNQVFVATIVKITPAGVQSIFVTLGNYFLEGIAIDHSNNVFVFGLDQNNPPLPSPIFEITPGGVQSTFGSVPGPCFGLAFDSAGNLFAADDGNQIQTIYKFTPDGTRSVFVGPSAFTPNSGPAGLAFDRFGNLFVSTESGGLEPDAILKFTPDGTESTFATGLNYPRGLAFDRAGNLFVAELIQTGPGDILKFTPNGVETVFASGIGPGGNGGPEFLAFQLLRTPRPRPTPHPRPLLP
jgi:sugar lactone lactonase YvrE